MPDREPGVLYREVTVKRCEGGWVIKEKGKPDKVVTRWQNVKWELGQRLYPEDPDV